MSSIQVKRPVAIKVVMTEEFRKQILDETSESLKKNKDFKAVYSSHKSRANKTLIMYVVKNGTEKNRLGISVSKKVGNSVVRHHLTRLIREIYRRQENSFVRGIDIVVVVRPAAKDIDYNNMKESFLHLAGLHGIIQKRS